MDDRAFRVVFEQSTNPMVVLDDDRRILEPNPAAVALLGRDLAGVGLEEIIATPPLAEQLRDWERMRREGSLGGRRILVRTDGATVPIDFSITADTPARGRHLALVYPHAVPDGEAPAAPSRQPLTPRELEVVQRLALGESGAQIAGVLFLSPATVRTHVQNAMGKLGARTRAQLIALVLRDGVLP